MQTMLFDPGTGTILKATDCVLRDAGAAATATGPHPDTGVPRTTEAEDVGAAIVVGADTPTFQDVLITGSKSGDYLQLEAGRYSS